MSHGHRAPEARDLRPAFPSVTSSVAMDTVVPPSLTRPLPGGCKRCYLVSEPLPPTCVQPSEDVIAPEDQVGGPCVCFNTEPESSVHAPA